MISPANMFALAGGRGTETIVQGEIKRLAQAWQGFQVAQASVGEELVSAYLSSEQIAELDLFDRLQLNQVLEVCREARSLAETGRMLFDVSRAKKTSSNDFHRLKQYLGKFDLRFSDLI